MFNFLNDLSFKLQPGPVEKKEKETNTSVKVCTVQMSHFLYILIPCYTVSQLSLHA